MRELDGEITKALESLAGITDEPLPPAPACQRRARKFSPAAPLTEQAWRVYGVDLQAVPAVSSVTIGVFLSELGSAVGIKRAFPTCAGFCSWLALFPDNRISGGRVLKAKTRAVASRISAVLRMAAQPLGHSQFALGDYSRRMKARLGKAEGITATAHKLARILYTMITKRVLTLSKRPCASLKPK